MTEMSNIPHSVDTAGKKVPRIAIMGEFSAGKSTLCNLLMNGNTLPRKVTATQLAPVWMAKGNGEHFRVKTDGTQTPITIEQLTSVPLEDTSYIRLGLPQEIFDLCELIDFPGISDPNMDPDVWARLLDEADAVIWLTHATQAWRQTEAAVWDIVSEEVQKRSLLLLTRWDKVTSELDRVRIQRRLERETKGLFKAMLPISLLAATNAGEDAEAWHASGAEPFMSHLTDLITDFGAFSASEADETPIVEDQPERPAPVQAATVGVKRISGVGPSQTAPVAEAPTLRVVPRRVVPSSSGQRERPLVKGSGTF